MASINYVVNAVDSASDTFKRIAGSADDLLAKLDDIGRKNETARVALAGDKDAELAIDKLELKMATLAKKVAEGKIGVEGQAKAITQIDALSLKLDELGRKRVTATVDVNTNRGLLSRIGGFFHFGGGGGGGGGGAAGAAGEGGGFLSSTLGGIGSLGPYAQGGLYGGLGALAAILAPAGIPTLLGGGIGGLGVALADPKGLKGVMKNLTDTVKSALAPLHGAFHDILTDVDGFIKSMGPSLQAMFKASLPFLNMFVKVMEQAGKIILPAVTQSLNEMVKSGALKSMEQGFVLIIQGIANMIKAIGPRGMQDSAKLFADLCRLMSEALTGLGKTLNFIAVAVYDTSVWIHKHWDQLREGTAVVFDEMRHSIASAWDSIYSNTIGTVIRLYQGIVRWFQKLPGGVEHSVSGLGTWLYNFGKNALTMIMNGAKSVVSSVTGFFSGFAHGIVSIFKKIWGWFSPSATMYEGGRSLMEGLFLGIRDHAHKAQSIAAKVGKGITGALGGYPGGSAPALAITMANAMGWTGAQWTALNNVAMRESGWSMTATNPSSGAYGIAQFIGGPSEYYQYGGNPNTLLGQLTGFYNYILQRYGSPGAAWQHELSYGWYDRGGWLQPGLTLAMNNTGRPERVVGPGDGGGNTYNITVQVAPGGNLAEAGRQTVAAIREFEKRAGKSWRS